MSTLTLKQRRQQNKQWTSAVLLLHVPRRLGNAWHLFVCLSVCLLATLRKNYWTDLHKILPQMCLRTRKNWLNLGRHPLPDPVTFWRILQQCKIAHFSTIWLISLDKLIGSSWKFYSRCNFEQGSPRYVLGIIQIWSPYPEPRYGRDLDQICLGIGLQSLWAPVFI